MEASNLGQVASAPYSPNGVNSGVGKPKEELGKHDFMKLLTTQLAHQDPMNPSDSTAFMGQLAQFSSLEALNNLEEGLDILAITQTAGTSAQMVSFIGKEVEFDAESFVLDQQGEEATMSFSMNSPAESVNIFVKNEAGEVVRTMELDSMMSGEHSIAFDGLDEDGNSVPAGTYSFAIVAKDSEGAEVNATTRSQGTVQSVVFDQGYPQLLLEDGRRVLLSQVFKVFEDGVDGSSEAAAIAASAQSSATDKALDTLTSDDLSSESAMDALVGMGDSGQGYF
jgi:flagellar basal-body rod modification protein FlgD